MGVSPRLSRGDTAKSEQPGTRVRTIGLGLCGLLWVRGFDSRDGYRTGGTTLPRALIYAPVGQIVQRVSLHLCRRSSRGLLAVVVPVLGIFLFVPRLFVQLGFIVSI